MNPPVAGPLPRCCPEHHDWATLARHLVDDFSEVPVLAVIRELRWARQAGRLFGLELADALDCAELIVRQRVLGATGRLPLSTPAAELPAVSVHVA
jgi:hypothetical protein